MVQLWDTQIPASFVATMGYCGEAIVSAATMSLIIAGTVYFLDKSYGARAEKINDLWLTRANERQTRIGESMMAVGKVLMAKQDPGSEQ